MDLVKEFDKLDMEIKLILTIFFDPILAGIYRILKGNLIVGIIWIVTSGLFGIGWIIDIVTIAKHNKYTFIV